MSFVIISGILSVGFVKHCISDRILTLSLSGGPNVLPQPIYGSFIAVNSHEEVIIVGGCSNFDDHSSFQNGCYGNSYSTKVYVWDTLSSIAFTEVTPAYNPFIGWTVSNGYPFPIYQDIMYVPFYDKLYKYDSVNKTWHNATIDIPVATYHPCTVYDKTENKIYLLGGSIWSGELLTLHGFVQIYDVAADSWISWQDIETMPVKMYGGSCVATTDRTIYYFGGSGGRFSASNTILKYDIDKNQWDQLSTTIPNTIFGSGAIVVNDGNIFIFGGAAWLGGDELSYGRDEVYLFQTTDQSIASAATMHRDRYAALITMVNNRIYIGGGCAVSPEYVLFDTEISVLTWDNGTELTFDTEVPVHTTETTSDVTGTASDVNHVTDTTSNVTTSIFNITDNDNDAQKNSNNGLIVLAVILSSTIVITATVSIIVIMVIRKNEIVDIKHVKFVNVEMHGNNEEVDILPNNNNIQRF